MCPPTDSPNDGHVTANRVVQTKSLKAGFDYGDQEVAEPVAAAYQFKNESVSAEPVQKKAATLSAPNYNPTANNPTKITESETETAQLKSDSQGLTASAASPDDGDAVKPNNTGLPDGLKAGVESLSGVSLDGVKVHYNSPKPAGLQAHAYAQGTNIHLGSGQEKHLAHEAWHVVQQKQGRVKPTTQMKGKVPVNDDAGLEKEADLMGAKALQMKLDSSSTSAKSISAFSDVAQMTFDDETLKTLMGAFKFGKVEELELLDVYRKKTRSALINIRNMKRTEFIKEIEAEAFIRKDNDDPFKETETQGWLGWGLSAFGFGAKEDDGDGPELNYKERSGGSMYNSQDNSSKELSDQQVDNVVSGKDLEEETSDDSLVQQGIKAITINIVEKKGEYEQDMGKMGEFSASAKTGLEYSPGDGHKITGKAEIEIELGHGGKKVVGLGTFGSDQNNMSIGGIIEGFAGAKGEMEGEAEYNPSEQTFGAKGKVGASAGVSAEGSAKIMLRAMGKEIATANISGGIMAGLALQGGFTFKYDKGHFTLGSGGKMAAGVGLSWSYHMSVDAPGVLAKLGDSMTSFAKWGASSLYNKMPSIW